MYVYETITSRRTVSAHCRSGNLGWLVWELIFCPKMSTALSPPAGRNPDNVLGAILLISTFAQVTEKHPHTLSIEIHWLEVALTSPGGQNFGRSQCPLGCSRPCSGETRNCETERTTATAATASTNANEPRTSVVRRRRSPAE